MKKDQMATALAFDGQVRIIAAVTTELVSQAVEIHHLLPVPAAALGRALTGVALMSNMLKNDTDKITLQMKGNGPLGGIVVVGDRFANVKGYVHNPSCDLPIRADGKLDVSGAVGRGYLQIIKDLGMREPYTGMVNLISGEIAEDLAYYFASSEQIHSAVGLGVLIHPDGSVVRAGGYMLQLMPGATEECISYLEKRLAQLPSVVSLFTEDSDPQDIVRAIFEEHPVSFLDTFPCRYTCSCSRDRMERNMISIGAKDLRELAEEQEKTELVCHFCDKKYHFSAAELLEMAKEAEGSRDKI